MSLNTYVPVPMPMQVPASTPALVTDLSSKLLHSWYDHEDERCISGVVQDEELGYDMHTITGARPSIYKEILQGLEDMKLACMWNESEWRDYAFDRRSYSYSSYTNSCASDITDSDVYSLCDGCDGSDAASITSEAQAQAQIQGQHPSLALAHAPIDVPEHSKSDPGPGSVSSQDTDAFMHLYKGYQKYAYY